MARDNNVSISGNLTRDPELRFTPNGAAVCSFGLAWNPPGKPDGTGGYKDAEAQFYDIVCWTDLAEHVAETLTKGMRVTVVGNLEQRSWEDKEGGGKRSKVEIRADEVGPSLRWATADVTRTEKGGGGSARPTKATKAYDADEEPF